MAVEEEDTDKFADIVSLLLAIFSYEYIHQNCNYN